MKALCSLSEHPPNQLLGSLFWGLFHNSRPSGNLRQPPQVARKKIGGFHKLNVIRKLAHFAGVPPLATSHRLDTHRRIAILKVLLTKHLQMRSFRLLPCSEGIETWRLACNAWQYPLF